jgi:GGDEF domain-containing protein
LGGDEFVVLCPFATEVDAVSLARRVRAQFGGVRGGASVSMGIASAPPVPCEIEALVQAAGQSMYAAKRLGIGIG